MRVRLAALAIAAVPALTSATGSASLPAATPGSVKPLMFQLDGKLLDAICPDAMSHPVQYLAPSPHDRSTDDRTTDDDEPVP